MESTIDILKQVAIVLIILTVICGVSGLIMQATRQTFKIQSETFRKVENIALFAFFCGCVSGIGLSMIAIVLLPLHK